MNLFGGIGLALAVLGVVALGTAVVIGAGVALDRLAARTETPEGS